MDYSPLDRVPLLNEGIQDSVISAWRSQGLPDGSKLSDWFTYDQLNVVDADLYPRPELAGPVLTEADRIKRLNRMNSDDPERIADCPNWADAARRWRDDGHIIELPIHDGLFLTMGVEEWSSFEAVLYKIADEPLRVRAIMEDQAVFAVNLAERILKEVKVDYASFSEPIASCHGPLISPKLYRDLALSSYRPILDVLRRHGVESVVWTTYGNALCLIPDVLDAGFNVLRAHERECPDMDYMLLRKRFGSSLRLIGGIDTDNLLAGPEAIDFELNETVAPLLEKGGYIPLPDGRVRANMPLAHYIYYRRNLENLVNSFV